MKLEKCRERLEELEVAREELIRISREIRILSSKAIVSIHSGKNDEAKELISKAKEILEKAKEFKKFPEVYFSIVHEAMQELAEAEFFFKAVTNSFSFALDFEVESGAFLTGLADVVGELRRYALSKMISGDLSEAEKILELMEKIYLELITFTSMPERLLPGFRQKIDVARIAIERTKSDLLTAKLYATLDRN